MIEPLHINDLILNAESVVEMEMKFQVTKQNLESTGLKVDQTKIKVVANKKADKILFPSGKWPFSI